MHSIGGFLKVRALLQRVSSASVAVGGRRVAAIDAGLLAFVGVLKDDDAAAAQRLAARTLAARLFPDPPGAPDAKPMNRSVLDIGGGVLAVSQFTLAADTRRGNRPSFAPAAAPEDAEPLYGRYVDALRSQCPHVATGIFGADMRISLVNDGPVTVLLDTHP